MKKKVIRVTTIITAFVLAGALAIPVFANTVSFSRVLPAWKVNTLITIGKKDGKPSYNMKVDVRSVGNNNGGFYCAAYRSIGSVDYRATANTFCPVNKVTKIGYNDYTTYFTGDMHLYGWAQHFGPFRTSLTGIVAFH